MTELAAAEPVAVPYSRNREAESEAPTLAPHEPKSGLEIAHRCTPVRGSGLVVKERESFPWSHGNAFIEEQRSVVVDDLAAARFRTNMRLLTIVLVTRSGRAMVVVCSMVFSAGARQVAAVACGPQGAKL